MHPLLACVVTSYNQTTMTIYETTECLKILVELFGLDAGSEQGVPLQVEALTAVCFGETYIANEHRGSLWVGMSLKRSFA
jgi:hypothetical protein